MWGPSLALTHPYCFNFLPSSSPCLQWGAHPWGWVELDIKSGDQLMPLCCSLPVEPLPVLLLEWGQLGVLAVWLFTRELPTWRPFRQDLNSQGKCSWTNMAFEQSAGQVGEMQERQMQGRQFPPFVLHQ